MLGDTENREVPALVTRLLQTKSVVQVTAGRGHTACLTADGLLFMCGDGGYGQLGVGDITEVEVFGGENRVVPTLVRGELQSRKVLQVAAGGHHTVCVTEDGSVFAFGYNLSGQLGVGDRMNRLVPTLLRGELENKSVLQVAAGSDHTICTTSDGSVFTWGNGDDGLLGLFYEWGFEISRLVPTPVTGYLASESYRPAQIAVFVAAGDRHTLCITADGSLFSWGCNGNGQLGIEMNINIIDSDGYWMPQMVPGFSSDWDESTNACVQICGQQGKRVVHVAAGTSHTICSTADGSVFAWGAGADGKLVHTLGAEPDESDWLVPTLVGGDLRNKVVMQVAAGGQHSACVTNNGSVHTWGNNNAGQLGVADVHNAAPPMLVRALDINATA